MSLGTYGFQVVKGDLVKVISDRFIVPKGTIAEICGILSGRDNKYLLDGYEDVYIEADELELVSYTRNLGDAWL